MTTGNESALTEQELRARFEDLTLDPDALSHVEHVRLAWTYLRDHPLLDVLTIFPRNLKRYASSIGASSIYNETVTWAFLMVIAERMSDSAETWDVFARHNQDLLSPKFLERYYDAETLASERAKRIFVFPRASRPPQVDA